MNIFRDKYTGRFSAVNFIIWITVPIWLLTFLFPAMRMYILAYGGLFPDAVLHGGQVWRLISYAFLHDPNMIFHIGFNMLGLWMFGKEIEYIWGNRKFFVFYFFTALFAGLFSLLIVFFGSGNINIIGASGALMALLVVYAYYFPERRLWLFFVIPMKAKTTVIVFAVISIWGTGGNFLNISHITHLGGIIAGFVWIAIGDKVDLFVRNIIIFFQNKSTKSNKTDYSSYDFDTPPKQTYNAEKVDKILDKINRSGIQSLTPAERKILQDASANS